jgi:hypothetical protein
MSTHVYASTVRIKERRRTERLPFRETVFVCGRSQRRAFKEETSTLSISANGALVTLSTKVSVGQRVLLMNPQTWEERQGYVSRLGEVHNERTQVAIEFAAPAPEFWPIESPITQSQSRLLEPKESRLLNRLQ